MNTTQLAKYLPILDWGRTYDRSTLTNCLSPLELCQYILA